MIGTESFGRSLSSAVYGWQGGRVEGWVEGWVEGLFGLVEGESNEREVCALTFAQASARTRFRNRTMRLQVWVGVGGV